MEERNNSKQVLLSVIGIAVLVIAVIGVSFAFFSYVRTGSSNNLITTGQIYMNFEEENAINITNQFPMLDSEALTAILKGRDANGDEITSEVAYLNFTVTGYYSASTGGIDYQVYALAGDPGTAPHNNRFANSEISVFLTRAESSQGTTYNPTTTLLNNPTPVNDAVDTTTGWQIATGRIKSGTTSGTGNNQVDSYTLAMFVNDTVRISDNQLSVPFTGATHAAAAGAPAKYCASAYSTNTVVTGHDDVNDVDITRTDLSGCQLYYTNASTKTGLTKATVPTTLTAPADWLPIYSTMYYSLKLKVEGNEASAATPAP